MEPTEVKEEDLTFAQLIHEAVLHEIPTGDTLCQLYNEASAGFEANNASIYQLAFVAAPVTQIRNFNALQGLLLHLIMLGFAIGKKEIRKEQL